jgi:type IV pilus assembly protein PilB
MAPRVRLGELLVEAQIITREQLEEVLAVQKRDARRLGTLLIESGLVSETQVTQVLSQQLSIPWVSLYHIDFSRQLLELVSQEVAEKYCLVPIFVRRVRGVGETLYIAMDDPTHEEAKDLVGAHAGMPVRAMIAPPSDIQAAIRVYYAAGADHPSLADAQAAVKRRGFPAGLGEPTRASALPELESLHEPAEALPSRAETELQSGATLPRPEPKVTPGKTREPAEGMEAAAQEPQANVVVPSAAASATATAPKPRASAEEPAPSSRPAEGIASSQKERGGAEATRGRGARMLTLTLLDGTQIQLPQRAGRGEPSSSVADDAGSLHDLIVALKALSQGADAHEILGDHVRWEAMLAALLSLLLKKHLISDGEFMEEYKKT